MPRRSAHTVTYKDLLTWLEKQLAYARQRRSSAPGRGVLNCDALTHDVECAETLLRMVKKGLPGRQTDFKALFDEATR